jgi:hypothetical protein
MMATDPRYLRWSICSIYSIRIEAHCFVRRMWKGAHAHLTRQAASGNVKQYPHHRTLIECHSRFICTPGTRNRYASAPHWPRSQSAGPLSASTAPPNRNLRESVNGVAHGENQAMILALLILAALFWFAVVGTVRRKSWLRSIIGTVLWFLGLLCFMGSLEAQCTPLTSQGWCQNPGLSAIQNNLLGPLIPYGASPWIFGDLAEKGTADNMAPAAIALTPTLGTQCPGTASWTQGTPTITTTADMTACLAGKNVVVLAWNSVDGPGTGRAQCPLGTVTSTIITCSENLFEPTSSGVAAYNMPPAGPSGWDYTSWTTENPSVTWNYYGVDMGLDKLGYRTANAAYHTYAQQYQDITWQWTIDHGYRFTSPRAAPLIGQVFRALEGHPERFPGLYNWMTKIQQLWADPTNSPAIDNREAGYAQWDISVLAKTDTDPTRHAQYCTWLGNYTAIWNSVQAADGSWPEEEYALNPSYVSAPKAFTAPFLFPGAPWREAINVKAMESAYESLNDTSSQGCNNPTLAAATLTAITNAVTWQNNYGRDTSNRGIYYEVNSQSDDQDTVYPGTGTISCTLTSTACVGVGTNWKTAGYCDGTHFIGFNTVRNVYKISSCADDTHLVLTAAYGLYSESGNLSASPIAFAPAAFTGCHSSATYCFGAGGDRNLTRTTCGAMGWLYSVTQNVTYKFWVDECISATLGGPTAGLTSAASIPSFVLPCSGPACDGYVADTFTAAPPCPATPQCVNGGSLYGNLGKNFGEAFGAPGIDNALAWRLLPSTGLTCDVNHDGVYNVLDVQLMINQVLGTAACTNDLSLIGTCNVIDVQRVVNALLGAFCRIGR